MIDRTNKDRIPGWAIKRSISKQSSATKKHWERRIPTNKTKANGKRYSARLKIRCDQEWRKSWKIARGAHDWALLYSDYGLPEWETERALDWAIENLRSSNE